MDTKRVLDIASGLVHGNHGINVYVVPQPLGMWPSFRALKQQNSLAPDVLCIRTDPVSTRRQDLIIESLIREEGGRAIVVGSPGIGMCAVDISY